MEQFIWQIVGLKVCYFNQWALDAVKLTMVNFDYSLMTKRKLFTKYTSFQQHTVIRTSLDG